MGFIKITDAAPIYESIDPSWTGVYSHVVADGVGSITPYTYMSVFNPPTSNRLHIALSLVTANYAISTVSGAVSMLAYRTSAASGGTLAAASSVVKFSPTMPDSTAEVRTANPTTTTSGLPLIAIPPAYGGGAQAPSTSGGPAGASFLMVPGQGIQFAVPAGDTDQRWNLLYIWAERTLG